MLGTRSREQERVGNFLAGLANRKDKVKRRCRTVLETKGRRARARFPEGRACAKSRELTCRFTAIPAEERPH